MHVGINTLGMKIGNTGGLQIYTENLLHALARIDKRNQYSIFVHRDSYGYDYPKIRQSNFQYVVCSIVSNNLKNISLWQNSLFYPIVKKSKINVLHSPANLAPSIVSVPSVLTLHDAISFHKDYLVDTSLFYRYFQPAMIKWGVKRADAIITVSESSKLDIVKRLEISEDKVKVIYHGVPEFSEKKILSFPSYSKPYILWVGRTTYFKNLVRLIQAYHILRERKKIEYSLYLVGMKGGYHKYIMDEIRRLELENNVCFLGYQSRDQLKAFYEDASLFVFPSLIEGFGFPVLEAMSCGVPIVTSQGGALKEIVADAAYLVDPENVENIAEGMWKGLSDYSLRQILITKGKERVNQFSWETCARKTLEVYKQVVG